MRLGRGLGMVDEPGRPAQVDVGLAVQLRQQRRQVQLLRRVTAVVVKVHLRRKRRGRDALAERGALGRARTVVHLERSAASR